MLNKNENFSGYYKGYTKISIEAFLQNILKLAYFLELELEFISYQVLGLNILHQADNTYKDFFEELFIFHYVTKKVGKHLQIQQRKLPYV